MVKSNGLWKWGTIGYSASCGNRVKAGTILPEETVIWHKKLLPGIIQPIE